MFYCVNAALPQMQRGACITNTISVAAYRGNAILLDYAASAGAIVSYTRSLALALLDRGIRASSRRSRCILMEAACFSLKSRTLGNSGVQIACTSICR